MMIKIWCLFSYCQWSSLESQEKMSNLVQVMFKEWIPWTTYCKEILQAFEAQYCLQMLASGCSKVVASTATYPHEVIRSQMHVRGIASFHGFVDVCKEVSNVIQPSPPNQQYKHCNSVCLSCIKAKKRHLKGALYLARTHSATQSLHKPVARSLCNCMSAGHNFSGVNPLRQSNNSCIRLLQAVDGVHLKCAMCIWTLQRALEMCYSNVARWHTIYWHYASIM